MIDSDIKRVIRQWWQSMNLSVNELNSLNELNKGYTKTAGSAQRAVLRRCTSIDAACMTEGFRSLWSALGKADDQSGRIPLEVCAAIAAVLSQIKADEPGLSFAAAAGRQNEKGRIPVSEMRFARLQDARTLDELVTRLRRLLPLIKYNADVSLLAEHIVDWSRQKQSNRSVAPSQRIAMRWAMDYYAANDSALASQNGET